MKKKFQPLIYRTIKWYYRKPRKLNKRGIEFILQPTVFHPDYYHSTDYLLDFILKENLTNKNVLELGCGSGFISMYLAKETKANCYASDINPNAVKGLVANVSKLQLKLSVIESDLFDNLNSLPTLDFILVNPPYFEKEITSVDEYAFYTGKNHSYFQKFFPQVKPYLQQGAKVFLVISENVKLNELKEIATLNKVSWDHIDSRFIKDENFTIIKLCSL